MIELKFSPLALIPLELIVLKFSVPMVDLADCADPLLCVIFKCSLYGDYRSSSLCTVDEPEGKIISEALNMVLI